MGRNSNSVCFDVSCDKKGSDTFKTVKSDMTEKLVNTDSSRSCTPVQKLPLSPKFVRKKREEKDLISLRNLGKLTVSKSKSASVDPTKPNKLREVIDAELTSFNVNGPKVPLQSSESWIVTRDSNGCDTSNVSTCEENKKLPKVPMKPISPTPPRKCGSRDIKRRNTITSYPSFEYDTDDVSGYKKRDTDSYLTISRQTKDLLERSKSLVSMIEYQKPKPLREKSERSSSFKSVAAFSGDTDNNDKRNLLHPFSYQSWNNACHSDSDKDKVEIKVPHRPHTRGSLREQKNTPNKVTKKVQQRSKFVDGDNGKINKSAELSKKSYLKNNVTPILISRSSSDESLSAIRSVSVAKHVPINEKTRRQRGMKSPRIRRRSSSAECPSNDTRGSLLEGDRDMADTILDRTKVGPNVLHSTECFDKELDNLGDIKDNAEYAIFQY